MPFPSIFVTALPCAHAQSQFIDDVEFWFKPGPGSRVEYRSASRLGESDGDINRKRIRAIRQELEKKKWRSVGF